MLQNILPVISECVIAFDLSLNKYISIGPHIGLLAGYNDKEVPGERNFWYPIIPSSDLVKVKELHVIQQNGQTTEVTYCIIPVGTNTLRHITEKRSIYIDTITGHQVVCCVLNEYGSSDQKQAEEELNRARANLESLINNIGDHVWSINTQMCYIYTNAAYKNAVFAETGIMPTNGHGVVIFGTDEVQQLWRSYCRRALSGERFQVVYERLDAVTYETQYYEIGFNPIHNAVNEIIGMGCFARDVTEHLKHEKEIYSQNARLRNIASISSHELRRPVASMLGLINIIDFENFNNPENKETISHLLTVGKEIDEVIRLIVNNAFSGKEI